MCILFAISVAANSILSFFPFVVLMMTLIRRVFHSRVMYEVVLQLLRDYLPAGQEFVIRNLNAMVNSRQRVQAVSLVILLVTSSGIFLPLEVALNRIWRFENNRSLSRKSVGLAGPGICLRSFGAAFHRTHRRSGRIARVPPPRLRHRICAPGGISDDEGLRNCRQHRHLLSDLLALPNGKVPARAVLPSAIVMGLLSEALKYAHILALPWLNFQEVYGPFALSVT